MTTTRFKSQWKQDEFLNMGIFRGKKDGFFVDIGAHDGVDGSNSYFFEKELGWKGICIEPITERYVQLIQNRDCFCMNCCIYDKVDMVPFTQNSGYTEMLSGITNTYDSRHIERIIREQKTEGGNSRMVRKPTYPLNNILELHNVREVDYLSIDTEGSEYSILFAIDFNKYVIKTISVENNYPDDFERIDKLLTEKGFSRIIRLGGDEIYINTKVFTIKLNTPSP